MTLIMCIRDLRWSAGLRHGVLGTAISIEPGWKPAFQYFESSHLVKGS
jgi:hypothetical protein